MRKDLKSHVHDDLLLSHIKTQSDENKDIIGKLAQLTKVEAVIELRITKLEAALSKKLRN
jgi:hypothetical protein